MDTQSSVEFLLGDDETMVVLNNVLVTVGWVVGEKRKQVPAAKVAYHTMEDKAGSAGGFVLQQKHNVCWVNKADEDGAGDAVNQSNIAGKLAPAEWGTAAIKVVWIVRWTTKGLMPARPAVYLVGKTALSTGRALSLE